MTLSIVLIIEIFYNGFSGLPAHQEIGMPSLSPKELGGLEKLRLLDLQRTHYLRMIPQEAISRLSQLRFLNLYYSYGGWELLNCEASGNDVSFADLEGLGNISTLGITVVESSTLRRLSGMNTLLKCIKYLYIKECEGLFYLQFSSASRDGKKLRRLSINNCYDVKRASHEIIKSM